MKRINNVMLDIMRGPAMCSDLTLHIEVVDEDGEKITSLLEVERWRASILIEGHVAYGLHKDTEEELCFEAFGPSPEDAINNLDAICENEMLSYDED